MRKQTQELDFKSERCFLLFFSNIVDENSSIEDDIVTVENKD